MNIIARKDIWQLNIAEKDELKEAYCTHADE